MRAQSFPDPPRDAASSLERAGVMSASSLSLLVALVVSCGLVAALLVLIGRLRHGQQEIGRAGDDLRRSEERFRRLAESSPLGIFELDADGRRVYANPRLLEIVRGDVVVDDESDACAEMTPPWNATPEDADDRVAAWHAASAAMRPHSGRWRIQRADGVTRWIRFDASPLVTDGVLTGWIGSVADVTEEQRLSEQHERVSGIIEATPDLVTMIDGEGHLIYANEAARQQWGIEPDDDLASMTALETYAV